ncbi:uncharacterized protein [Anoplolepis gracilipes]|uniref:uncharacterized protein n=1 Tax=Anoplolepis gracilipes TaxID=354296 RepID=UPI003B9E7975
MENKDSSVSTEHETQYTAGFLKNGIVRGIAYQLKLLTWVSWKMISKKDASKWWLGSEVVEARGFHDLVLKYVNNTVDEKGKTSGKKYLYRFVQIKHMACLTGGMKISISHLLSQERDGFYRQYSLIYLFKSYMQMITKFENITPEQIVDITVFTNRNINTSLEFLVPVDKDEIFGFKEKGKHYRFNLDVLRQAPHNPIVQCLQAFSRREDAHVWNFLSKLVFAVGQPSEPELERLIVKDMGKVYNTPQIFYNDLFKNITEWFLVIEKGSAPYLTEEDIKKKLKKMEEMLLAEKRTPVDSISLSNLSLT